MVRVFNKLIIFLGLLAWTNLSHAADYQCISLLSADINTTILKDLSLNQHKYDGFWRYSYNRVVKLLKQYPPETHIVVGWGVNNTFEATIIKIILGDKFDDYYMQSPIKISPYVKGQSDSLYGSILSRKVRESGKIVVITRNLIGGAQVDRHTKSLVDFAKKRGHLDIVFDYTHQPSWNIGQNMHKAFSAHDEKIAFTLKWHRYGGVFRTVANDIKARSANIRSEVNFRQADPNQVTVTQMYMQGIGKYSQFHEFSEKDVAASDFKLTANPLFNDFVSEVQSHLSEKGILREVNFPKEYSYDDLTSLLLLDRIQYFILNELLISKATMYDLLTFTLSEIRELDISALSNHEITKIKMFLTRAYILGFDIGFTNLISSSLTGTDTNKLQAEINGLKSLLDQEDMDGFAQIFDQLVYYNFHLQMNSIESIKASQSAFFDFINHPRYKEKVITALGQGYKNYMRYFNLDQPSTLDSPVRKI